MDENDPERAKLKEEVLRLSQKANRLHALEEEVRASHEEHARPPSFHAKRSVALG